VLDNKWFRVRQDEVELPNGEKLNDYFIWNNIDVSLVVPVTIKNQFVLVRQYKHGIGKVVLEFPAGYIDSGEDPEKAARRELAEETGYSTDKLTLLTRLNNNATKETATIHVYLAEDVSKDNPTNFDNSETIETVLLSPEQTAQYVLTGKILVSASVVGAFLALHKLKFLSFNTAAHR